LSAGFVVDASVGFSWVHESQATAETDKLLDEVASGHAAVVPSMWFLEIANVLLMAQRRRRLTAAQRRTALATLGGLGLVVDEEGHRTAFFKTSELAEKHRLTVYDAAYLELASRRKLPLASRDEALVAAAKQCGIKVL
jgi:predicted nucleic acid-binding protein